MKRSSGVKTLADPETASLGQATESTKKAKPKKGKLKKDWNVNLIADGQVQPNMWPAKFSFNIFTASCSDFVVYPTGVAGSGTAANIVAYNNLYTGGCTTGTVPSVYWAYNTGGGTVTTSPIIAEGGSQVAFIQVTGTTASLVLLKPGATGTLGSPASPTLSTASGYRSCTAPCYYAFSLGANDTYSAPFYDYLVDDAIYVGDDSGKLHKITGVFYGATIAETSPWPKTLNASYKTASPVYDPTSGYVFVGNIATGTNAALYAVNSTNASINATSSGLGDAIVDGTLVDPNTEKVYAFVTTDATGHNGVYQFAWNFASATAGTEEEVGFGGTGYYFYSGNFDNVYYSAASGAAGDLWVVGNTGGSSGGGGGGVNLYRIPIGSGNAMSTPVAAISGLTAANTLGVTEFATNSVNVTSTSTTGSISLNLSTLSGSDNYLLVGVSIVSTSSSAPTVSSIKWGGSSGTALAQECFAQESGSTSNWVRMEIWALPNPSAISNTVAITLSGSTVFQAGAVAFTNVASLGTCVTQTHKGGDAVSSTSVTVAAPGTGGAVFDTLAVNSIVTSSSLLMTPTAGQTPLWNVVDSSSPPGDINCQSGGSTACSAGGAGSYAGNVTTMSYSFPGPSLSNTAYGAVPLIAAVAPSKNYGWPSPITEFCNAGANGTGGCTVSGGATTLGTDYLFFSVDGLASATGTTCSTGSGHGCVLGYNVTTPTAITVAGGAPVTTAATPGCWSTSAIEIDNSVPSGTLAGASQIYTFELNGNGAGGPTDGTYTSSACNNADGATPKALQASQSNP
jgi:hypothetical protein